MPRLITLRSIEDAPAYRPATEEGVSCSTCRYGQTGECRLYNFNYQEGYTCDSWEEGVQEEDHESVMVALMLPRDTAESLSLSGMEGALPPTELHLTLAYLGKIINQNYGPNALLTALRDFAFYFSPIPGRINGIGRFNAQEGEPEAFYASFDSPELPEFRQHLIEFLEERGFHVEANHGFTPHITLGYLKPTEDSPLQNLEPLPVQFNDITIGWGKRLLSVPMYGQAEIAPAVETVYAIEEEDDDEYRAAEGEHEVTVELTVEQPDENFLMSLIRKGLERWGLGHLLRSIKDVESWDGAASQYETTPDYCDACLVNLNTGDRENWSQALCKLPVRGPGDAKSVYVRQAVYAAAARFNQLKKPSDVPDDEWNTAVTKAAKELVKAYGQMDEDPPETITEAAKGRGAISQHRDILTAVYQALQELGREVGGYFFLHAIQAVDGETSVIAIHEGRLIRAPLYYVDEGEREVVGFGAWELLQPIQSNNDRSRITVSRAANGRYHYLMISSTPFVNRVGEIDSTQLYDAFIQYARTTGEYPRLDFYHFGEALVLGRSYFLDRVGLAYVEAGWFDDTPEGRSFAEAVQAEPNYWGNSIEFRITAPPLIEEVAAGVYVPVYRAGIHRFTSLLPEAYAAALFTRPFVQSEETTMSMTDEQFEAFLRGTQNLSDEQRQVALERVRAVKRAGESGEFVYRTADPIEAVTPAQFQEGLTGLQTSIETVIRSAVGEVQAGLDNRLVAVETAVSNITHRLETAEAANTDLADAVEPLVNEHRERQADAPAGRQVTKGIHIPRFARLKNTEEQKVPTMAETAQATTNKIFGRH